MKPKTAEWEKEFYSKFTHDWPPEFYRKEEMKDLPRKVVSFINSQKAEILDEVINKIKERTKNIEKTYLITEHKEGHDESYPISNLFDEFIKLLTDMRNI